GVHQFGAWGALGAFTLGYFLDTFSGTLLGLHAFAFTALYLAVHYVGRLLWTEGGVPAMLIVFAAACGHGLIALAWMSLLTAAGASVWQHAVRQGLITALVAAAVTPAVFGFVSWGAGRHADGPRRAALHPARRAAGADRSHRGRQRHRPRRVRRHRDAPDLSPGGAGSGDAVALRAQSHPPGSRAGRARCGLRPQRRPPDRQPRVLRRRLRAGGCARQPRRAAHACHPAERARERRGRAPAGALQAPAVRGHRPGTRPRLVGRRGARDPPARAPGRVGAGGPATLLPVRAAGGAPPRLRRRGQRERAGRQREHRHPQRRSGWQGESREGLGSGAAGPDRRAAGGGGPAPAPGPGPPGRAG